VKVGYMVSRFPTDAETFIVREMNALADHGGFEIELMSLYPPGEAFAHPSARRWLGGRHRPRAGQALGATLWWAVRRPLALAGAIGAIVAGHARSPAVLARALITVPIAAAHARRARAVGVEHVHAHFATYPALAAWLCFRLTGVPYSFTAHAHDIFIDRSFLTRKVRDARFVVAISRYNRRLLADHGGGDTPVEVVHCGIDPAVYPFRPRTPPADGPVRALCVASLMEHKGHPVLFEALATPSLERVRLELVGGRDPAGLEALARRLRISDRVRFLGGLPEEEVARLLGEVDLFVLPSIVARDGQMEGIPVALMEAMACGLPVVASRLSGIPELVEDGVSGFLAEPGDVASLRSALERALAGGLDPGSGRARVEGEFAIEGTARRMARLLEDGRLETG